MIFRAFLLDVNESNAFVVGCERTREALLVDVGQMETMIVDFIAEHELRLTKVFITHDHYDHTSGLDVAVDKYRAEVYSGSGAAGGHRGRRVAHGDEIRVGQLTARVLATPGHTPDSVSLAFPSMVFTGDALFSGSVGGTSSPQCAQQQIDSLRKHVLTLPGTCEIHPGHGPSSTVAIERTYNPFFV